jgi:Flp pilus assembly protein TadG
MKRSTYARAGNAMVEFALVFGLLWLLLTGCFRVGYAIYLYQSVLNAVAGAARYAARVDFDEPGHTFVARVRNMAVYGDPAGGIAPLAPGLTTDNISVTWEYDAKSVPVTLTVSVMGFGWSGKPSITVRYAGSYKT